MPDAPRSSSTRAVRYLVGAVLGAAGLYASFASVDWPQLVASFSAAGPWWVAAAALSILLTLIVVTERSVLFLDAGGSFGRWRTMWNAVIVGQAVNIIVPFRFGEGARVAFTCRALGVPAGRVVVGIALERIFDVVAFAVAVLLVVLSGATSAIPGLSDNAAPRAMAVAVMTVIGIGGLVWVMPAAARSIGRRVGSDSWIGRWLETQQTAIRNAWTAGTRPHLFLATVPLTALMTVGAASTNFLVFRAFDLEVPLITSLALLVILQIGTSVASVPGNVGVFHYLTVVTLGALNVPRADALAVAVVLHAVAIGPKIIIAAMALARRPPEGGRYA